jgi:hypothetical protein
MPVTKFGQLNPIGISAEGNDLMHLNTPRSAEALPFVLANAKPYALEQYEDDALGYYDPITQTWRGTLLFHKSSTSRNVTSTSGRTSDSDLSSDVLGN